MRKGILHHLLLLLFMLGFAAGAGATHIMGGTTTYKYVGNNKYAIEIAFYRSCNGSTQAAPNYIYYYTKGASNDNTAKLRGPLWRSQPDTIISDVANCTSTQYCAQKYSYRDTITLSTDTVGYHIYYSNTARNSGILNLGTNSSYLTWYGFVPAKKHQNSSPAPVNALVPTICVKKKNIFNAGVYDPDGDSLVFSFVKPYTTGTPPSLNTVNYASNYSLQYPFGTSSPKVIIDSTTGEIIAEPQSTGLYVLAIQVQEYRKDPVKGTVTYLGEMRLDLQFIVLNCGSNPAPEFVADTGNYSRTVNVDQPFCIKVSARDTNKYNNKYDSLSMTALGSMLDTGINFPKPYATFTDKKGDTSISSDFCWTPGCGHITYSSPHVVTFRIKDQGCNIVEKSYSIYVKPRPFVDPPTLKCVDIVGDKQIRLTWDTAKADTNFGSYTIWRKMATESDYAMIGIDSNRLSTTWLDTTATYAQDTVYQYYIRSANTCGANGVTTDTLQSIIIRSQALTEGNREFTWNKLNNYLNDSFVVYADTGAGTQVFDTITSRTYLFRYCSRYIDLHVKALRKDASCTSGSNTLENIFIGDVVKPAKDSFVNASVTAGNKISLSIEQSKHADVSHYLIMRSEDGASFSKLDSVLATTLGSDAFTYTDTSAKADLKRYYYQVIAVDYCGNTTGYDSIHAPVKLDTTLLNKQVNLSWTYYTGYKLDTMYLERWDTGSKGWTVLRTLTPATGFTNRTYSDHDVQCGLYAYRVRSTGMYFGKKQVTYSDSIAVTPFDTVKPQMPPLDHATVNTNNTITVKVKASPSPDVKDFIIYGWKNGISLGALDTVAAVYGSNTYSFIHSGITPYSDRYCYTIRAVDSCGNLSDEERYCPVELQGYPGSLVNHLNWHPYIGKEADMHIIQRAKLPNTTFADLDTVVAADTAFNDSSIICNVVYMYRIKARQKADQQFVYSDTLHLRTFDSTRPVAPVIEWVTVFNPNTIRGSFLPSASTDVKSYNVYSSANGSSYQLVTNISHTGATSYQFSQTGVNAQTDTLTYIVEAVDSCAGNKSINGIPHTAIQLSNRSGNLASYLTWNGYAGWGEVKNYFVQRFNTGTGGWDTIATIAGNLTQYTDSALKCNTAYWYRISATDTSGKKYASVSDTAGSYPFDTLKPPTVNIVSATVRDNKTIELFFDTLAVPDVNRYEIYASENGGPYQLLTTRFYPKGNPTTAYLHSGLNTSANVYRYKIFALDSCGNNKSDTTEIHSPPQLEADKGNKTSYLKWKPYEGFNVRKYFVQRQDESGNWILVDSVPGTDTTYADTGLGCNKKYLYRIYARENGGDTAISYSDTISVTPFDTVKPAQVNILYASVISNNTIELKFDTVPDPDVNAFYIYASKNGGAWSLVTAKLKPSTGGPITYQHSGLNTLKDNYCYRVTAVDTCAQNESATSEVHCAMRQEGYAGNYENYLFWSFYKGFTVKEYVVEWNNGSAWVPLVTLPPTDSTYVHDTIPCTSKTYRIKAVENGGDAQLAYSNSISLTPFDTVKPVAPEIEYVSVTAKDKIYIKWKKSPSNDVRRYDVYRKYDGGSFSLVTTLGDVDEYTDNVSTGVNSAYCYAVKAVDSCAGNNSVYSGEHCTVYFTADTNKCEYAIYLDWTTYKGWPGVSKYNIYRTEAGSSEALLTSVNGGQFNYKDAAITIGTQYCYRIEAVPLSGSFSSFSASSCANTYTPEKPEIRSASKASTSNTAGEIVVKWKSVAGKRFYSFYRLYSRVEGGTYSLLQDNIPIATDSFVHTGLDTRNKDYEYYLVIVDSCGNNTGLESDRHKSINLSGTVGQLIHNLSWTSYKGWPVDKYIVERFEGTGFKTITTLNGTDTNSVIFPAPCNYNIIYRIKATNTAGQFAYSDTISRLAIDTIPPNAATIRNLSVTSGTSTRMEFRGADSADVYKYVIQRARNGSWLTDGEVLFTTPGATHIYDDNINTLTDRFCYTIITLDSCLNATMTDTFCAIQLKGQALNQANRIDWHPFEGYPLDDYNVLIYRNNTWDTLSVLSSTDTALIHDSLHCYLPYYYKIQGVQSGGFTTYSDSIQLTPFDTIIPPASSLRYATVQDDHSVKLEWGYDTRSDVKFFEIWRSVNFAPAQKIATNVFDSIYIDKGVNPQKDTLKYYVISIDSCNSAHRSKPSDTDKLMNIKAETGACVPEHRINWTAYTDLPAGTAQFVLHRKTGSGSWGQLQTFSNTTVDYVDHNVTEGTWYCYRVEAVDPVSGYSSFSDSVCITPWVFPRPDTTRGVYTTVTKTGSAAGEIYLEWQRVSVADTFARRYRVYRFDPVQNKYVVEYETTDLNNTGYTYTGANTQSATHRFYVATVNNCNVESEPTRVHRPVDITIQNAQEKATIVWTPYLGERIRQYELFRSMDGKTPVRIATFSPADTSYVDSNMRCNHYYTYQVKTALVNGSLSESDTSGVWSIDNIPAPQADLYAVSVDTTAGNLGNISISFWGNDDRNRSGYNIFRSENGGAFSMYYFVPTIKTDTLYWQDKGANTEDNIYSYYLRSVDSCGNIALPLDTHTAVHIDAEAYSHYMKVDWTAYEGWGDWDYVLEKQQEGKDWKVLKVFNNSIQTYNDSDVVCHVVYNYRIRSRDKNSNWISFSNIAGDTAIETEQPLLSQILRATVLNTSTATGRILLEWNRSASDDVAGYHVYRSENGKDWTLISQLNDSTALIDDNLNTYRNNYHYRIQPEDYCGNLGAGYSIVHRSMVLQTLPGDQEVALKWTAYTGWTVKGYAIIRNGKVIDTAYTNAYSDTAVLCGRTYTYEVAAVTDSAVHIIAYSNADSSKPYDTKVPQRIYVKTVSVFLPNKVAYLEWEPSASFDASQYLIFRRYLETGELELVDSTANVFYYDSLLDVGQEYCYVIYVKDVCGNISFESNPACVIKLSGSNDKGYNALNWNEYRQWRSGIRGYNIYKSEDGGPWKKVGYTEEDLRQYIDINTVNDVLTNCYQIEAIEANDSTGMTSRSTVICLNQAPIVWVPNAFTPQTTFGNNDKFGPQGMFIKDYDMKILNRWGQIVFQSTDEEKEWDGTVDGKLAPGGVYIYHIDIHDHNGKVMRLGGNLTLIR